MRLLIVIAFLLASCAGQECVTEGTLMTWMEAHKHGGHEHKWEPVKWAPPNTHFAPEPARLYDFWLYRCSDCGVLRGRRAKPPSEEG